MHLDVGTSECIIIQRPEEISLHERLMNGRLTSRWLSNKVSMVMLVKMAPPFPLIFLLMIHMVSSADWGVKYRASHICALKDSSVIMSCTYTYPTGHQIMNVYWTKYYVKSGEPPDLSEDPEYSQRLQYLGDKQQNCTVRLSHVTKKDEHKYYFRFTTDQRNGKWIAVPGVRLSVTDLQLESPERVTEGDSVRLTCNSSCNLTDTPTFIWYRNSQRLTEGTTGNKLILNPVRGEDAGRYRCAVDGHTLTSPEVYLNVTYPPKSVSVFISGSAVIMSGDSVTLSCSSDSNPPALIFSWLNGETFVGSGRIFSISNISSDDSEKYKCRARNEHGEKSSDPVTLNIQYPPRNVSVSITDKSGQLWFNSVSLMCISDSNPPALSFSWFKENQSSAVGSGQSFSAVQSGRFYCEAHNPHGAQRSDAVTVTVKGPPVLFYISIGVVCGATVFITMGIIWGIRRMKERKAKQQLDCSRRQDDKCKACDVDQPVYENATAFQDGSGHCELDLDSSVYENLPLK